MMSKKKWCAVLCLFIVYLLLGAGIFYNIESQEEILRLEKEQEERKRIEKLLFHYVPHYIEDSFFENLTNYCGKPLGKNMSSHVDIPLWDFYHSLFFVITVVSTMGYGNLAPTTMFSRIFMIFYGLIGIPMNGIVMVTLGAFFGHSFEKLYQRWKTSRKNEDITRLGLISQIILYLVPGFTFFIFLPGVIMVIFEGWPYDVAVYYAFVSLTTIGFGDYVAGTENTVGISDVYYRTYQIFLLIWMIGGLGYVLMILGFITKAMRSKQMRELEHMITHNIVKTPIKIRHELRSLLQEFLFMRVKPVYKNEFQYVPHAITRSQSCPDLTIYRNMDSPSMKRKRAFSECPPITGLQRIQSETDLNRIDKERTFSQQHSFREQQELIRKVVDALGNIDNSGCQYYNGFTDEEILASERYPSLTSSKRQSFSVHIPKRRRAVSEVKEPEPYHLKNDNEHTWYGQHAVKQLADFRARMRMNSEPTSDITMKSQTNWLTKIKNKFLTNKDENLIDVEKQPPSPTFDEQQYLNQTSQGRYSLLSLQQGAVLEQTSIADFIRALSAITTTETVLSQNNIPQRKLGTAGISSPNLQSPMKVRRAGILATNRRSSLIPDNTASSSSFGLHEQRRRFSLRPVEENLLISQPPPYTPPLTDGTQQLSRRYSRVPTAIQTSITSPVQRQLHKKDRDDNSGNC